MIPENKYVPLSSQESSGRYGTFGAKIFVAGDDLPDLDSSEIWNATHEACRLIESAIRAKIVANNPDAQAAAKAEREQLLGCFPETIYIEELPNGYCSDWCCKHLPWFLVTTKVGRIKIGWRKRVINIEWNETKGTKTAEELFPNEDTTKGMRMIHAWSGEKAKEYVAAIIASV